MSRCVQVLYYARLHPDADQALHVHFLFNSIMTPLILWLRNDLRLDDHPGWHAALAQGQPILPLYIWSPGAEGNWPAGAASKWWLHHSLAALDSALRARGSRLLLATGEPLDVLRRLCASSGARAVYWTRRYDPVSVARDQGIKQALREDGCEVHSLPGSLLREPFDIRSRAGTPFQVFTPFFRHYLALGELQHPLDAPEWLPAPAAWPDSTPLDALELLPGRRWAEDFARCWQPGVEGAQAALERWLAGPWQHYAERRDQPGLADGVSALSPFLHSGELSPRRLWWRVHDLSPGTTSDAHPGLPWLRQLVWREFAHHLLFHFPHTDARALRREFDQFPWREPGPGELEAWQSGRTGYPLVDAGMRQLWQTGWMHNRVRMVVASFLVKHLLLDWRLGAAWFWDTLVDADLANNTLGWQWSAGCGADAAPYFRIFNPVTQSRKFDPEGCYIRRWVPELAALPDEALHAPWERPLELQAADITLDVHYPAPMVDHTAARARALDALARMTAARRAATGADR
jgi:deoxyribodipyrimidine photo-lyase